MRLDLIFTMRDKSYTSYTSIPTRTHSQNSVEAAEAPSLKISSHGTCLITKTVQVSMRIVVICAMKRSIPLSLKESQWKPRQQQNQNFLKEGQPLEKILVSEERNKSKRAGLKHK